jgi:UDP-3-O-[3-hydroxymyristoyl] N-acetylglucosamine deacetylase
MRSQQTIQHAAACQGVGIHSAAAVRLHVSPAPANSGVVFVRSDVQGADGRIPAHIDFVTATNLGTTLRNAAGAEVATVEHLLAACAGLGVDNLLVAVDGPEMPILDGSAVMFAEMLLGAGLKQQASPRRAIRMRERVAVTAGTKSAALEPAAGAKFDVTIRYDDAAIGLQRRIFALSPETFMEEIAEARTYGFLADVDRLHAAGRGRGASLENTLVIDGGRVINPEGLRHRDEFVRHKILDAVGDMMLAGAPIIGRYVADQPGHALNAQLVRALLAAPHAWTWDVEPEREVRPAAQRVAAVG